MSHWVDFKTTIPPHYTHSTARVMYRTYSLGTWGGGSDYGLVTELHLGPSNAGLTLDLEHVRELREALQYIEEHHTLSGYPGRQVGAEPDTTSPEPVYEVELKTGMGFIHATLYCDGKRISMPRWIFSSRSFALTAAKQAAKLHRNGPERIRLELD